MTGSTDHANSEYPWVRISKTPVSYKEQDLQWLHKLEEEVPKGPQEKEIHVFGVKISYSRAFGIAFLILFILLFFPGIGVSSSAVKKASDVNEGGKGSMDKTN